MQVHQAPVMEPQPVTSYGPKPSFEPTPQQIQADCHEIQKTWAQEEEDRRRARQHLIDRRPKKQDDTRLYLTPKDSRYVRKRDLLRAVPYCRTCGLHLTDTPHVKNQAHLVENSLYCHVHVNEMRQGAWTQFSTEQYQEHRQIETAKRLAESGAE